MQPALDKLTILHFNDVYNIEEIKTDPVGGAARFKTALDSFKHLDPLILFSGDLFQPSLLGTLYNGEQMIKPVNDFGVDVACFGNHEFDLEIDELTDLIKKTNFPWLLSNVKDVKTLEPLCAGKEYHVLTKNGLKIGFVGLAEEDWLHVANSIEEEDIVFENYLVCAKRLTKILREEHQCDLIIALTHMRTYNDIKLAELFTEFDIILGGHDHVNSIEEVNRTYVIKSGCDFREFNKITMTIPPTRIPANKETIKRGDDYSIYDTKCKVEVETIYVTTAFEPEPSIKAHVDHYFELFQESMKLPMFYAECELETRFGRIRKSEQNLPNFLADVMRLETESDCSLLNTGTIRSDFVFQRGIMKLGDIRLMLPYGGDLILKVELTGEQLVKVLENGVSKYPALEGRWPALSGVSFEFNPKKEAGKRINIETIRIRNGPIDMNEKYILASKEWIIYGKDGYEALAGAKILTDESVAEELHVILKRFFEIGHDASFLEIHQAEKEGKHASPIKRVCHKKLHFYEKLKSLIHDIVEYEGSTYVAIKPQVEGRIKIVES